MTRAAVIGPVKNLGLGLGLRNRHFQYLLNNQPKVDWFEAISENFMDSGGKPRYVLRELAERYPIVLHGVSMSIGSVDPLDFAYLGKLKSLAEEVKAPWVSDHLCWTGVNSMNSHDLLPLPLNEETLEHVIARVKTVQEFLGQALVLENPSRYLSFEQSTLSEPEFFRELVQATSCRLLLDVNNVYVTGFNNDFDPADYIREFPMEAVVQIHIAGHSHCGTHIIDTHDQAVAPPVWELYRLAYQMCGGVSTLLEWDGRIPNFETCLQELNKAKDFISGSSDFHRVPLGLVQDAKSPSTPIDFMVPDVMNDLRVEQG